MARTISPRSPRIASARGTRASSSAIVDTLLRSPHRCPTIWPDCTSWLPDSLRKTPELTRDCAEGERAAAEVVARRRGEVGHERRDVLVGGRVAGQHRD